MKTPAPHSSAGHSRLSRWILPFSSTWRWKMTGAVHQRTNQQLLITGWVRFYLVVLEYGQLDLLPLMLVLLGGGVGLLLPFLGTTTQPQHQVERRLLQEEKWRIQNTARSTQDVIPAGQRSAHLLDVVVGQCASILQLLPSEDQPLLVRRDTCRRQEQHLNKFQQYSKLAP